MVPPAGSDPDDLLRESPCGAAPTCRQLAWINPGPTLLSVTIEKVSIEEGCISCSLCMDIAPDVFDVPEGEDCVIQSRAADHFQSKKEDILLAAADCPVEVIVVEEDDSENAGSE